MEPEHFSQLLQKQNHSCAICKTTTPGGKGTFHVDHCHATGAVRGLLCMACNIGIGKLKDSPELLDAAASYLRNTQ